MTELTNREGEYSSVSSRSLEADEECDEGWISPTAVANPCVIDTSSFYSFDSHHKAHDFLALEPNIVDSKAQKLPTAPPTVVESAAVESLSVAPTFAPSTANAAPGDASPGK
jgi:hypothetical protein